MGQVPGPDFIPLVHGINKPMRTGIKKDLSRSVVGSCSRETDLSTRPIKGGPRPQIYQNLPPSSLPGLLNKTHANLSCTAQQWNTEKTTIKK